MTGRVPAAAIGLAAALSLAAAATGEPADTTKPVKVFILAGQSNMEGKAKVELLQYQASQPATRDLFKHLQKDGKWAERDDVWVKFLDRKGNLTVGYGSPNCIGPELEFGNVVGDHYAEQVLLVKTAWGGRSLYRDFRSPSAGLPAPEVLQKMLAGMKNRKPAATLDDVKAAFGASYRAMLEEVASTLANLKTLFPTYAGQGCELAGFVWFQGWNDMIDDAATAEYAANMAHFIRDVRKDLKVPNLPFVIGQMGVGGEGADAKVRKFKDAQAAAAALPEFKGNVALVKTDAFWDLEADAVYKKGWRQNIDQWKTVGSDHPYHYLGSAKTLCRIGKAFGEAVLALGGEKRAAPQDPAK
jgi:alpha-galactosidase